MPLGTQKLKDALKFIDDFTMQIAATKKFRFTSIFNFIDDLLALGGVITSWKDIIAEWKDLDTAEKSEIIQYVKDEFDIPDDEVEAFIEDSFSWLLSTISLVERARRLRQAA